MKATRREFLGTSTAALAALAIRGWAQDAEALPPVRAITKGPRFHWRGYYDKFLFDPTNRLVVANEVDFEGRSPTAEDPLRVGMIDLEDGDRWTELGTTRAWNWQQGCMLQWVPGSASEVAWNDREGDQFVSHFLDVRTGKKRTLPHPFYTFSPDGRWSIAPDFRRLNDTRPGYGYAGIPDPQPEVAAPDDAGLWKMDVATGRQDLLLSFADATKIPHPGGFSKGTKHWFNHLLVNTDGTRFLFLHRWRGETEGKSWKTRMITMDPDGKNPHVLIASGKVSHFVWRDATHVTAYAGHPETNEWRFITFEDRTGKYEVIGDGILNAGGDGHNTFVPGTGNQWVINDTYPDKAKQEQHPHLFHIPTSRRVALGHFHSPPAYKGEWRCDTHPSASRDGRYVTIDSPHAGGRQVYLIDIGGIVRAGA